MDEAGRFYRVQDLSIGTHLVLRWTGRVRYNIPREAAAQRTCWKVFLPGRLQLPLRTMTRLPRLFGVVSCVENKQLGIIREVIGNAAGLSCCRAGAPGPWSKDTILLLNRITSEPEYVVKAGAGEAVDILLRNEASWLLTLRDQRTLVDHVPDFVAHRSGTYLSFVAQTPLLGNLDYSFGEPHITFLRKLQEFSHQTMRFEASRIYKNLRSRLNDLGGLLTEAWSIRLDKGMERIEQSLFGAPILLVASHNDFTLWNIRVERGLLRVFDWENADYEQLPLFDPLHFALMPMALKSMPKGKMVRQMRNMLQLCRQQLGPEACYKEHTQALAYLMNLCTLYLFAARGNVDSNPVLESYAQIIDYLCHL